MIAKYFENEEGLTEPLSQIQNQADSENEEQTFFFLSPSSKPTHDFTDMSFIYVEEVVKYLSKIYFDESKMDLSSSIPYDLLKSASQQPEVDPTQYQDDNQPTVEVNLITGLEIVQYTDPLNFLADAVQSQIEKDTRKEVILSPTYPKSS